VLSLFYPIQMSSVKCVSNQNLESSVLNVSGQNQKSRVARLSDINSNGIKNPNSVLLQPSVDSGIAPIDPLLHQPYVLLSKARKAARDKPPAIIGQHV
jgi:hypothetical protein